MQWRACNSSEMRAYISLEHAAATAPIDKTPCQACMAKRALTLSLVHEGGGVGEEANMQQMEHISTIA